MDFIKKVSRAIFIWPLLSLYKNGPKVFLLWEGIRDESICYELTKVESSFWISNNETISACSELIERKSFAFVIAVYIVIFSYLLYAIGSLIIYKYFILDRFSAVILDKIDTITIRLNNQGRESATYKEIPETFEILDDEH
jgi:hypothetical protein